MLTCELNASLPVTTNLLSVQWMHRGSLVTGSVGFVLKQGSGPGASVYVTELTLNETTVERSGLYSCRVSIDRQQVTAEANLTVACEWIELNCHHLIFFYMQFLILMFTLDHPMDSPHNLYWVPVLD